MTTRHYSPLDRLIGHIDQGLRTVLGHPPTTGRPHPARGLSDDESLTEKDQQEAARLMRVNHCGEVCAQALYQGQALTAHDPAVREAMEQAAAEENDHLTWCKERVTNLGSHTSYLNPLFYAGSLTLGAVAGAIGDRWSLGFLAETERQVVRHLESHLDRLPGNDAISRAIVEQMREDEGEHASMAVNAGAAELSMPVKQAMRLTSKVMTRTTYWL